MQKTRKVKFCLTFTSGDAYSFTSTFEILGINESCNQGIVSQGGIQKSCVLDIVSKTDKTSQPTQIRSA